MLCRAHDHKLTDEEAERVGLAAGTPLQALFGDALRVLVAGYFDDEITCLYDLKYLEHIDTWKQAEFASARLRILKEYLGAEAFGALDAAKQAAWEQVGAAADAAVRALAPCVSCGRARTLMDDLHGLSRCGECMSVEDRATAPLPPDDARCPECVSVDTRAFAALSRDDDPNILFP
jgi:hypothetical protein